MQMAAAAECSQPQLSSSTACHAWEKSTKTALCIIPDESLWPDIQSIRGVHDKAHVVRWMPHINILFPFVAAHQMEHAAQLLADQFASTPPFQIRFDDMGVFSHSPRSHTFWLRPQTVCGTEIAELHRTALKLFPLCDDARDRPSGFCPHLTLGQTKGHAPDMTQLASLWPRGGGEFTCSRVFLLARSAFDDPFHVRHVVNLGGGGRASCDWLYTASDDAYWCDAATGQKSMRVP